MRKTKKTKRLRQRIRELEEAVKTWKDRAVESRIERLAHALEKEVQNGKV